MNRFSSNIQTIGDSADPDIVYYNASIVNNIVDDKNDRIEDLLDPPIRFNETRDKAILKNASEYKFSIIRFSVNGGNLDLPLFIPQIQVNTGQTDVNLTVYALGLTYSGLDVNQVFSNSSLNYVNFIPEIQNPKLAPLPRSPGNVSFVGGWSPLTTYAVGQIINYPITSNSEEGIYYKAQAVYDYSTTPPTLVSNINKNPTIPSDNQYTSTSPSGQIYSQVFWDSVSSELGTNQDISSRYYWVSTYSYWCSLVQNTLETANNQLYLAYVSAGGSAFANYTAWKAVYPTPIISYDSITGLFSIDYPPTYLSLAEQTAQGYTNPVGASTGVISLYMNTNMAGLFANFKNNFFNNPSPLWPYPNPLLAPQNRFAYPTNGSNTTQFPPGYTYLMIVNVNQNGSNLYSPTKISGTTTPKWIRMTQDYNSTSTQWSPIDALVFTTSLLPVMNEYLAPPNLIGSYNTGQSSATAKSAFQPILTDVTLDLAINPAGYRRQIYYEPQAEFRMSDFQNSKTEIRNIDLQVFWRNRLDNQLYPVSLYNLGSVSVKLMFRKDYMLTKSEKAGLGY